MASNRKPATLTEILNEQIRAERRRARVDAINSALCAGLALWLPIAALALSIYFAR